MKKVAVVWGLCVLCIFGSLTVFGFKYQSIKKYKHLENTMVKYAKEYNKENEKKEKITLEELISYKPKADFSVEGDTCSGQVKVKKVMFWDYYNADISCSEYKKAK